MPAGSQSGRRGRRPSAPGRDWRAAGIVLGCDFVALRGDVGRERYWMTLFCRCSNASSRSEFTPGMLARTLRPYLLAYHSSEESQTKSTRSCAVRMTHVGVMPLLN